MLVWRLREVRVVDDDSIDIDLEKQDDDVDQWIEVFLKKFWEEMRLQRQELLYCYRRGESLQFCEFGQFLFNFYFIYLFINFVFMMVYIVWRYV